MEPPARIEPRGLNDYLETMSKSVFQSGISWKVVEAKWPGIREAFRDFDVEKVADFTEADIDALTQDTRVIRNRRKIAGVVHNAGQIASLDREYGGFRSYLRSHSDFEALVRDVRGRFKFMGDMGVYHFMWIVNEDVPPYEEFCEAHRIKSRAG